MQCRCHHSLATYGAARAFSTSARRPLGLQLNINDKEMMQSTVPEWPYGPTRLYKQAAQGLYGGRRIRFGNNTSEENRQRTRRTWKPNVRTTRVFSKALDRNIHLKITARVLRTIDKVGGLDEYLLGEKEARIKELGEAGWMLRWVLMQTPEVKKRYTKQRIELGLQPPPPPPIKYTKKTPTAESAGSKKAPTAKSADSKTETMTTNRQSTTPADSSETTEADVATPTKTISDEARITLRHARRLAKTAKKKIGVMFRVDHNRYVHVSSSGRVLPVRTQKDKLKIALRKLSPTATLKWWEKPWNKTTLTQEAFFAERAKLHKECYAAYKKTLPFQPLNWKAMPPNVAKFLQNVGSQERGARAREAHWTNTEKQRAESERLKRLRATLSNRAKIEEQPAES